MGASKKIWDPLLIFAAVEAGNFKFGIQRLGVKLEEGAGLEKHPENLGPPMYFCNR